MRRLAAAITLALALAPSLAAAGDPPRPVDPQRLVGKFGLMWTSGKPKCKEVDAATATRWAKLKACVSPDPDVGTASGKPLVASCKVKKQEHLIFATKADCTEEQETQAANAE